MREGLDEPVSVLAGYNTKNKQFRPLVLTWNGVDYRLGPVDFYHKTKKGAATLHHFSLTDKDETTYFKLKLDANSLNWTIEEYMMAGHNDVHY